LFCSAPQVLFCRYNDPSYVKLEKLEIMVKLASAQNIDQARAPSAEMQNFACLVLLPDLVTRSPTTMGIHEADVRYLPLVQVLMELKEYASEVDVEFVRKVGRSLRHHTVPPSSPSVDSMLASSAAPQHSTGVSPAQLLMSIWADAVAARVALCAQVQGPVTPRMGGVLAQSPPNTSHLDPTKTLNISSPCAQAVRAIGRCAVKLDVAAERCINVLVELIKGRVSYVVQEAVVVVRDIFRKYPNRRAPNLRPIPALKTGAGGGGCRVQHTWKFPDWRAPPALPFEWLVDPESCWPMAALPAATARASGWQPGQRGV
jgi:Adaptin N terminal region